ncbi:MULTISPECIES: hypothetical protein [unclassified Enterococcus]|uniref:hypothetical protein n=1 Tax=unclassified Enterococcus TaxID=2608891 RepID=UPI003D285FE1
MEKEPNTSRMQLALSIIKLISDFIALDNRAKVLTTQCLLKILLSLTGCFLVVVLVVHFLL